MFLGRATLCSRFFTHVYARSRSSQLKVLRRFDGIGAYISVVGTATGFVGMLHIDGIGAYISVVGTATGCRATSQLRLALFRVSP